MVRVLYSWLLVLTVLAQCGQVQPSKIPVDKDVAILESLTLGVSQKNVRDFETASALLSTTAERACDGAPDSVAELERTWKQAMEIWHRMEALSYGPIADNPPKAGCIDGTLSCAIYSWPLASGKVVRRQMEDAFDNPANFDIQSVQVNAKGLDAMEFLIFKTLKGQEAVSAGSEACPYLSLVATDIAKNAQLLKNQFLEFEVSALQKSNKDIGALRKDLDRVVNTLDFFEQTFLYRKVNWALKLRSKDEKGNDVVCKFACEKLLEHPEAEWAVEGMVANLHSLRLAFEGGERGFGIYHYLVELGQTQGGETGLRLLADAEQSLENLPRGLEFENMVASFDPEACLPEALCEWQKASETLSRFLKADLRVLLSVSAAKGVAGDND